MSTKALIKLAVLWLLLPPPGLSITNCIELNSKNECVNCFQSSFNPLKSCTPFKVDKGCSHVKSLSTCSTCKPSYSYYSSNDQDCQLITANAVFNCVKHKGDPTDPSCIQCSNGIPAPDLKSCLPFSTATSSEQPEVANCAIGERKSTFWTAGCAVCNAGFALELSTDTCASATTTGCWTQENGACTNCRAWDGYFADDLDKSTPGQPVVCKTAATQTWNNIVVAKHSAEVNAQLRLMPSSLPLLLRSSLKNSPFKLKAI